MLAAESKDAATPEQITNEMDNILAQMESTELVKDEVEDHRENTEVQLREMFSGIRLSLMKRKRYVHRLAEVMATLKQEKLTTEFEDLFNISEEADALKEVIESKPASYLDTEEAVLGITNFVESNPVVLTRQTAVVTRFSHDLKDKLNRFGKVSKTSDKCLIFFLIGACAKANASLISDALALIAQAEMDADYPLAAADEVGGVVECLAESFGSSVTLKAGFSAPILVKNAMDALTQLCLLGPEYLEAIGESGGIKLAIDYLDATIKFKNKAFPEMTSGTLMFLSNICKSDKNLALFMDGGGLKKVVDVVKSHASIAVKRLESALRVIVTMTNSKDEALRKKLKANELIPLLLSVAATHKTVHSSQVHTLICTALYYFVSTKVARNIDIMLEQDVVPVLLGCLLPRITTSTSAENIGVIFVELIKNTKGDSNSLVCKQLVEGGLFKFAFVLGEFQKSSIMQTIYLQAIHKLCGCASDEKHLTEIQSALMDAKLVVAVVRAMIENPKDVALLEQACHCLCSVSRNNEAAKEYMADVLEDSFYYGFNLIEVILEGIKDFADNTQYIEAAASASWSVCFKSPKMKSKAAEAGVFQTLKKVVKAHIDHTNVLPHVFAAISNLMANHPPNQVAAASEGIIDIALQTLDMYQENAMMARTVVFCIFTCLANQPDNVPKYEEPADVTVRLGPEIVGEVLARYEKNHDLSVADFVKQIVKDSTALLEMVTKRDEERATMKARADAGKLSMTEYKEARDPPTTGWFDEEKLTLIKKGSAIVTNSGADRRTNNKRQMLMLHKHELKFFENPENSKMMWPIDEIWLSLISSMKVEIVKDKGYAVVLETLNKKDIKILLDTKPEADIWLAAIQKLKPCKSGNVSALDAKGKTLPRLITWQDDCFFVFDTKKFDLKRSFMAERIVDTAANAKVFEFVETVHEDLNDWKFQVKDPKEATEWVDFLNKAIARKVAAVEQEEKENAERQDDMDKGEKERAALKVIADAERAYYEEESERRMIELAEDDDEVEEEEKMEELERQEKEAELEEAKKALEEERRRKEEAERRRLEEEAAARARDAANLQAYIDKLKADITAKKVELEDIREINKPKYLTRDEARNRAKATEEDLIVRKKEFDEVLGGRLGQILGDFDFEAVERAKQAKEMLMDEEDLRQQKKREDEAETLAHKAVRANLAESRAETLG